MAILPEALDNRQILVYNSLCRFIHCGEEDENESE